MTASAMPMAPVADLIPHPRRPDNSVVSETTVNSINVLGVDVAALTVADARRRIDEMLESERSTRVVYVNASCLNISATNLVYRNALIGSDLVMNDGAGLDIAARMQGKEFPANLNGTDFTPEILALAAKRGKRVFLLGGKPGVTEMARLNLVESIPGLNIVGTSHGFQRSDEETCLLLAQIRSLEVDVLLVGMGAPTQELWLAEHLDTSGAQFGVAVGAFLDFAAGRVPRAPLWMRDMKIEWIFRLCIEPRRLFRRYVLGNPVFIYRVAVTRSARHHRQAGASAKEAAKAASSKALGCSGELSNVA
jgi:exopolysaccharide biosynthesis WecB/TagA/CpsF family protein